MEHTRNASDEGWKVVLIVSVVVPVLLFGSLIFEMGLIWRSVWTILLLAVGGLAISYAVSNIRSDGVFLCRLTDIDLVQDIPVSSCGDSFQVRLSSIVELECYDTQSEGPSDDWYIHTVGGRRLKISWNYGNPAREFADALIKSCPDIPIKYT